LLPFVAVGLLGELYRFTTHDISTIRKYYGQNYLSASVENVLAAGWQFSHIVSISAGHQSIRHVVWHIAQIEWLGQFSITLNCHSRLKTVWFVEHYCPLCPIEGRIVVVQ